MASMNRSERAKYYFERLLKSSNPKSELEIISREIDDLVYATSNKPLDDADKLLIIKELERLIRERTLSINESRSRPRFEILDDLRKSRTTASDNSDILDVISAMKRSRGDK